MNTHEIVICAAVKIDGMLFRGNRHGDCMLSARNMLGEHTHVFQDDQGFITSTGRFVSREEGRKLQDEAGITSADPTGYRAGTLYSEDLY